MSIFSIRLVYDCEETVTAGVVSFMLLCWGGGIEGLVILTSKHIFCCD